MPGAIELASSTSLKKASSRSDHARGKSGSCSCHRIVVGVAIRCSGSGSVSASDEATVPEPARYQPTDAVIAPGSP